MWKFLPYIAKSLWRNRTRSLLTVTGAAVAMFVFLAGMQNWRAGWCVARATSLPWCRS